MFSFYFMVALTVSTQEPHLDHHASKAAFVQANQILLLQQITWVLPVFDPGPTYDIGQQGLRDEMSCNN